MNKTLVLPFDASNLPDWHVRAICRQMADWLQANKTLFPNENLVFIPGTGGTKLYWLEGECGSVDDISDLEEIRDRIKPVLEVALDIKIDKDKRYKIPTSVRTQIGRKRLS